MANQYVLPSIARGSYSRRRYGDAMEKADSQSLDNERTAWVHCPLSLLRERLVRLSRGNRSSPYVVAHEKPAVIGLPVATMSTGALYSTAVLQSQPS